MSDYNNLSEITHAAFQEERMFDYFTRRLFCDVKIIVGKYKYPAHKFVLQTNSEYFRNHLKSTTSEILVTDDDTIRRETVMKAMEFLYKGEVELKILDVANLVKFSEIIAQENLKNYCFLYMRKVLAGSKIIEPLNKEIDDYFILNFSELQKSEKFLHVSVEDLERYLESDYLGVESEEQAFTALKLWMEKDWDNRKKHFYTLLKHIRCPKLSLTFLLNEVKPLCNGLENCCEVLLDAIEWQYSPEKRSGLTKMNPKGREPKEVILIAGGDYYRSCRIIETYDTYLEKRSIFWRTNFCFDNFSSEMCKEDLYIVGGRYKNEITDEVFIFNLVTKNLMMLPSMYQKRSDLSVSIVQSQLFAIGGCNDLDSCMNTVERFCLIRKNWKTVASMSTNRCNHVSVVNNNEIYVIGGQISESAGTNSMEVYNVKKNKWTTAPPMIQIRYNFAATTLGDYIYVFGGIDNFGLEISSAEKFNTKTREWTSIADMPEPRWGYASVPFQEKILCLGGSKIMEYNPQSDTWRQIGILEHARRCHSIFVVPFKLIEDGKKIAQL